MGFWPVVESVIRKSNIIILVADARMPELSRNKEVERKIRKMGKEGILVFNKTDLISQDDLIDLKKDNPKAFFVSGAKRTGILQLKNALLEAGKKMSLDEPIIGIVGYPNVGKSSVINALAQRASANISPVAGTTRGAQWIKVENLLIIDSPGVIPFEDKNTKLGLIAAKNPEKMGTPEKVAVEIIQMFLKRSQPHFIEYFKLTPQDLDKDAYEILGEIGKKRGYLSKGGVVDETKTAIQIVREWQTGKLGFKS